MDRSQPDATDQEAADEAKSALPWRINSQATAMGREVVSPRDSVVVYVCCVFVLRSAYGEKDYCSNQASSSKNSSDMRSTYEHIRFHTKRPGHNELSETMEVSYDGGLYVAGEKMISVREYEAAIEHLKMQLQPPRCTSPGGKCLQFNGTTWTCECTDDYSGTSCEHEGVPSYTRTQFAYIGVYASSLSTIQTGDQTFSSYGKWSDEAINAEGFDFLEFEPVDFDYPVVYFRLDNLVYGSQTRRRPTEYATTLTDAMNGVWTLPREGNYDICNFGRAHYDNNVHAAFGWNFHGGCDQGPAVSSPGTAQSINGDVRLYGYTRGTPRPVPYTRTQFAYIGVYASPLSTTQTGDQTFSSYGKWSDEAINAEGFDFLEFEPVDFDHPVVYFRLDNLVYGSQTRRRPTEYATTLTDAMNGVWTLPREGNYDICNFGRAHYDNNVHAAFGWKVRGGCDQGPAVSSSGFSDGDVRLYGYTRA
ncbi:hypothetical protein CYMTET_21966 [Cymbomonas tetramitiformis]|uniref:EGF-like domain-containing protein n=1 Tax=Cymbomonas tetramitiformis TaxID=36881 RepID=A0AAE0L2L8_9CHLO|nr:hypothetical protein CYMTET_21966 [Cymbomonas tetramitiformis]